MHPLLVTPSVRHTARIVLGATLLALVWLAPPVPLAHAATRAGPMPATNTPMRQFTAGGHVLGFQPTQVYLAALDHALRIEFVGAAGVMPLADAASASATASPLTQVTYPELWPGISVTYQATTEGILKSTYHLAAGADAAQIRLRYNVPVQVESDGALEFAFGRGWLSESAPVAWQEIDGVQVPVPVTFEVVPDTSLVTFRVGEYDASLPLTIDPTYAWHTFYGSASGDAGKAIAVDGSGNVYVTGYSWATWQGDNNTNPLHPYSGNADIVVVKLNRSGAYQWHTFYGSASGDDAGNGIAVDGSGNVYVTGPSNATWQGDGGANPLHAYSGGPDIVVVKLNSSGAYQWHTFYGSASGDDSGAGIAVDGSGNVYVTGWSTAAWAGCFLLCHPLHAYSGGYDIVVVKLNRSGAYQWHTFYGSASGDDEGNAIAVDGSGNVYVTGWSNATWQGDGGANPLHTYSGGEDIVVVKLNSSGAYQWHTFYGSASGDDEGWGIALDGSGNVYVTGYSQATWAGCFLLCHPLHAYGGSVDIVVVKLNSSGAYQWHTFYGSASGDDEGNAIAVDGSGNVYVTGWSNATWQGDNNTNPLHAYGGSADIVVVKLNSSGAYQWHTFYGSASGGDSGAGIAVDGSGNVYVTGYSTAAWAGCFLLCRPLHAYGGNADIVVVSLKSNVIYLPLILR